MAASVSGSGLAGIGHENRMGKDDGLAPGLDKTMEGISLGSMDDGDVTEKGKGKEKEGGDVLKSLLFETVSRLSEDEKMVFMKEMSRKLDMGNLKKQGVQFDPEEEDGGAFGLGNEFIPNIPVPSIHSCEPGPSVWGLSSLGF